MDVLWGGQGKGRSVVLVVLVVGLQPSPQTVGRIGERNSRSKSLNFGNFFLIFRLKVIAKS